LYPFVNLIALLQLIYRKLFTVTGQIGEAVYRPPLPGRLNFT
jgi:hypothetical protein